MGEMVETFKLNRRGEGCLSPQSPLTLRGCIILCRITIRYNNIRGEESDSPKRFVFKVNMRFVGGRVLSSSSILRTRRVLWAQRCGEQQQQWNNNMINLIDCLLCLFCHKYHLYTNQFNHDPFEVWVAAVGNWRTTPHWVLIRMATSGGGGVDFAVDLIIHTYGRGGGGANAVVVAPQKGDYGKLRH